MANVESIVKKATETAKKLGVSDSTINAVKNSTPVKATLTALSAATSKANPLDTGRSSTGSSSGGSRTTSGTYYAVNPNPDRTDDRKSSGGNLGTSTDYGTYKKDLEKYTKAQQQAQVDALKAARTQALANLDAQEQNIKPMYQAARNQTSAASQQGARSFSEYLANRGLTNSGAAAQAEINRQSTLNNNLGNINTAEANAYRDIANQRTAVENNYVAGLANANNALTTNYYNNLLGYNEQQRQAIQQLKNQANYQYYDDIQARINQLLAQGYSPNSYEVLSLQALRGQKQYNTYNSAMGNAGNNVLAGNINYNNAAQLGMTVPQATNYYETTKAQQEAAQQQALEQELYNRQVAQDKVNREIAQQEFKNNLDYQNYLLDQQKVANDTAMTKYNTNKPYYKPTTGNNNNDNGIKRDSYIEKMLSEIATTQGGTRAQSSKINLLNNALANGTIDRNTYAYYYTLNGLPVQG